MTRKGLILATICIACAGHLTVGAQTTGSPPAETPPAATPGAPAPSGGKLIYISSEMRYTDASAIDAAVRNECQLTQQGAQLLLTAMRGAGFEATVDDQAVKGAKGRVLIVEISNVVSGRVGMSHSKQVQVRGRLMEDGKEVGSFQGKRSSGGGAFGLYKSSCAVLGRCLETLSKDITAWLRNPGKSNRVGE